MRSLVLLLLFEAGVDGGAPPLLGLGCPAGKLPVELELGAIVGRGAEARTAIWRIGTFPEVSFQVIDPMAPPPNVTQRALTMGQLPELLGSLEAPRRPDAEAVARWGGSPVVVDIVRRCPGSMRKRWTVSAPDVKTLANERLLAVALAIIKVAPADLVPDAGVPPEKTTGLAPKKERSP